MVHLLKRRVDILTTDHYKEDEKPSSVEPRSILWYVRIENRGMDRVLCYVHCTVRWWRKAIVR